MEGEESQATTKEKIAKFEEGMKGDHILVHLDSRRKEVQVPSHLKQNPSLTLKLSYAFQGETLFDHQAITTYLKFSGSYAECVLPWPTIWGITFSDGKQTIWPKDMPKELLIALAKQQLGSLGKRLFGGGKKDQPSTKEVAAVSEDGVKTDQPSGPDKPPRKLRRVK